jgi:hypothetical protein
MKKTPRNPRLQRSKPEHPGISPKKQAKPFVGSQALLPFLTQFMHLAFNFLIFTSFVSPFGETTEEALRKRKSKFI